MRRRSHEKRGSDSPPVAEVSAGSLCSDEGSDHDHEHVLHLEAVVVLLLCLDVCVGSR